MYVFFLGDVKGNNGHDATSLVSPPSISIAIASLLTSTS
jgi:hypothetical protein